MHPTISKTRCQHPKNLALLTTPWWSWPVACVGGAVPMPRRGRKRICVKNVCEKTPWSTLGTWKFMKTRGLDRGLESFRVYCQITIGFRADAQKNQRPVWSQRVSLVMLPVSRCPPICGRFVARSCRIRLPVSKGNDNDFIPENWGYTRTCNTMTIPYHAMPCHAISCLTSPHLTLPYLPLPRMTCHYLPFPTTTYHHILYHYVPLKSTKYNYIPLHKIQLHTVGRYNPIQYKYMLFSCTYISWLSLTSCCKLCF